jgi:hypothetical protein
MFRKSNYNDVISASTTTATSTSSSPSQSCVVVNTTFTNMCNSVLQSWAQCSNFYHQYKAAFSMNIRPIPQRAQYILERMELSYDLTIEQQQRQQYLKSPTISTTASSPTTVFVMIV